MKAILTAIFIVSALPALFYFHTRADKTGSSIHENSSGVCVASSYGPQHSSREALLWHHGPTLALNDRFTSVCLNDVALAANGDAYTTGCSECKTQKRDNSPVAIENRIATASAGRSLMQQRFFAFNPLLQIKYWLACGEKQTFTRLVFPSYPLLPTNSPALQS